MPMKEMVSAFREAISRAPDKKKVIAIYLFGIEHADALEGLNLKELARLAGEPEAYGTELSKARNLAPYVKIVAELE